MDPPRAALVIIILIFFLFGLPDVEAPRAQGGQELDRLQVDKQKAVALLNDTDYGALEAERDRWINITGLRQEDGYAWDLLPLIKERAIAQFQTILDGIALPLEVENSGEPLQNSSIPSTVVPRLSLYQNVTGIVNGQWTRSKVADGHSSPVLNLTTLAPDVVYMTNAYARNITGQDGHLRFELDEKNSSLIELDDRSIREVHAEMIIKDETSKGDGWKMTLHGVHYPYQGRVIMATTGQRFPGIFALPQFALTKHEFSLAQKLLNQTVNAVLAQQEKSLNNPYFGPWTSSPHDSSEVLFASPHCEYIVYLQQYPTILPHSELKVLEKELRFPTGASMPAAPGLRMSSLIFSPDCGFVLESKGPPEYGPQDGVHLVGQKLESYLGVARRCILVFAMILCAEIFLLIRQMNESSTPSMRSKVSFYTIILMAFGDAFAFMGLMAVAISNEAAFLPLISTTFLSFLCEGVFGMKFLIDIWVVQAPERMESERRDAAASDAASGADALPLPATARRTADGGPANVILPPDQDLGADEAENATAGQAPGGSTQSEMSAMYSRFYFVLFSISFLSLQASNWPTILRSIYTNALAFCYLSFWVPQIHRNIIRNCRQALRWEFVFGQSILRLIPIVYLYTVEDNILFVVVDRYAAIALVGWVWIQNWALISQEILGPRFFVPKGWAPPAYDYHPILREDDQEAGSSMPIGFLNQTAAENHSSATGTSEEGKRVFDCAICMQNLDVTVVRPTNNENKGEGNPSIAMTIFSRRAYMVTPCRHIFHSQCLQAWMRYRLQCPICRENLPPL